MNHRFLKLLCLMMALVMLLCAAGCRADTDEPEEEEEQAQERADEEATEEEDEEETEEEVEEAEESEPVETKPIVAEEEEEKLSVQPLESWQVTEEQARFLPHVRDLLIATFTPDTSMLLGQIHPDVVAYCMADPSMDVDGILSGNDETMSAMIAAFDAKYEQWEVRYEITEVAEDAAMSANVAPLYEEQGLQISSMYRVCFTSHLYSGGEDTGEEAMQQCYHYAMIDGQWYLEPASLLFAEG